VAAGDWLADLVTLGSCNDQWDVYLSVVYAVFHDDFVSSKPRFDGRRFAVRTNPMQNGKEAGFWHLISEGTVEAERTIDIRRCERIRWPRPIIEAFAGDDVRCWRNQRGSDERILIAIDDFSYLVVLSDRGSHVLLITAYHVPRGHRKKKLEREYEGSISK
jgi:hypothetical protein